MRCEHEHDDGAYVLGALSPAERAAYERHLATCSFCREAVSDMSALPDLLSRLDAKEFAKLLDPTLTHPGTHENKTRRVRVVSTAAAAVFVVLVAVGVFAFTTRDAAPAGPPPGPAVAMTAINPASPITATLRLNSSTGGTRVDLTCSYSRTAARPYTFRLIAYGPDEAKEQIGSWQAAPGAEFGMEAVTHFGPGALSRLELVQYDGKALLAYDVP